MKIKNSLDWQEIESNLNKIILKVKDPYKQLEARKVVRNFEGMITKLSKLEMSARTSPSGSLRNVTEQLDLINTELLKFEQWLTLLLLQ